MEQSTDIKILDAARKIFLQKGLDGARMQEIADEAGINKALVHYYFGSKEKLFEAIFADTLQQFFPRLESIILLNVSFVEKIEHFIDLYLELVIKNEFVPQFIIREAHRNPQNILKLFERIGMQQNAAIILKILKDEMKKGTIKEMPPEYFIIHIISLCVFPIVGRPLLEPLLFHGDDERYNDYMNDRKKYVKELLIQSIRK